MQRGVFAGAVTLGLAGLFSMPGAARGAVIISDDFNLTTPATTDGFVLNEGVNSEINPPTSTRLTGTAADGLRWMNRTSGQKPDTSYSIDGSNRLRINAGAQSGRISLSPDGTAAADFGPALGTGLASPLQKLEYDIRITMRNSTTGTQRMSFAWGTEETSAGGWDFGLQLNRAASTDTDYTVHKRVDTASSGVADLNAPIGMIENNWNTMVPFLIRVNDAGAESGTDYNSRVRVSVDDGATWIYDTDADAAIQNHFRFDGTSRFLSLDIAGGTAATFYDNLSIDLTTAVPEPGTLGLAAAAGLMLLGRKRRT